MANPEHFEIFKQGLEAWNVWRRDNPHVTPDLRSIDLSTVDLSNADLSRTDLSGSDMIGAFLAGANLKRAKLVNADLRRVFLDGVDLTDADLSDADLWEAHLVAAKLVHVNLRNASLIGAKMANAQLTRTSAVNANLSAADLRWADLREASLSDANLTGAVLRWADLNGADLSRAKLIGADLSEAILISAQCNGAVLSSCRVYGTSNWNINLEGAIQTNLIITNYGEPEITVDNLDVAQFIYLLLNNKKLRDVINTMGKKAVLILGRFAPERKVVLDAIRDDLRQKDYLPILFDFEKPASRDLTETISTLAHLSRFIIADITDAKSIPQELQAIVPNLPSVAVHPIIHKDDYEYAMFEHFKRYSWVLPVYQYESHESLIAALPGIIEAAEQKVTEMRPRS